MRRKRSGLPAVIFLTGLFAGLSLVLLAVLIGRGGSGGLAAESSSPIGDAHDHSARRAAVHAALAEEFGGHDWEIVEWGGWTHRPEDNIPGSALLDYPPEIVAIAQIRLHTPLGPTHRWLQFHFDWPDGAQPTGMTDVSAAYRRWEP